MNFLESTVKKVTIRSENPQYIDFVEENKIINLDMVYCFKKVDITICQSNRPVPAIRFLISKTTLMNWYYDNEVDRDFEYTKLMSKYVNKI